MDADAQRIAELRAELESLKAQTDAAKAQKEALSRENAALEAQCDRKIETLQTLINRHKSIESEIEHLNHIFAHHVPALTVMTKIERQSWIDTAVALIDAQDVLAKALASTSDAESNELLRIRQLVEQKRAEIAIEISRLQAEEAKNAETIKNIQSQKARLKSEMAECAEAEAKVAELNAELKNNEVKFIAAKSAYDDLAFIRTHNTALQQQCYDLLSVLHDTDASLVCALSQRKQ